MSIDVKDSYLYLLDKADLEDNIKTFHTTLKIICREQPSLSEKDQKIIKIDY